MRRKTSHIPGFIIPFAFDISVRGDGILPKDPLCGIILWMTFATLAGVEALAGAIGVLAAGNSASVGESGFTNGQG